MSHALSLYTTVVRECFASPAIAEAVLFAQTSKNIAWNRSFMSKTNKMIGWNCEFKVILMWRNKVRQRITWQDSVDVNIIRRHKILQFCSSPDIYTWVQIFIATNHRWTCLVQTDLLMLRRFTATTTTTTLYFQTTVYSLKMPCILARLPSDGWVYEWTV